MKAALPPRESPSRRNLSYHATLTPATETSETLALLLALGKLGGYYPAIAARLGVRSPPELGLHVGCVWGVL